MNILLLLLCLQAENLESKILARVNEFRKIAGLAPVELDAALSKGCRLHAEYLVKNAGHASTSGLGAHNEDPNLPGYTKEGGRSRRRSDMSVLLLLLFLQAESVEQKALARVNAYRKSAGLEAVELDAALSKGCKAHADYLVRNAGHASVQGLGAHNEDPKLPGYTEEGAKAGRSSDIHFIEPVAAVDGWMATLFHRVPILDPALRKIGVGHAKGGKSGSISVMDVGSAREGRAAAAVLYPADGQKDVPLAFGGEIPNPIPNDTDRKAGYPITVQFPDGAKAADVTATLKSGKTDVEHWLSTPEKPADARYQRNTVCLIAKSPLKPATTYTVTVSAKLGDETWSKTWTFTTEAARK